MNPKKGTVILIISTICACLIAVSMLCILPLFSRPIIGFYSINSETREAISLAIDSVQKETERNFKTLVYSTEVSLQQQLQKVKQPDILFLFNGESNQYPQQLADKKKTSLPGKIISDMPGSVKNIATKITDGTITGVPLLLDHYEVAIDRMVLGLTGTQTINSWADIEAFAQKALESGIIAPIVFAGQDDRQLLDITGALAESLAGSQAWQTASEKILAASGDAAYSGILADLSNDANAPLYATIQKLAAWYTQGILGHQTFSLTPNDVRNYMDAGLSAIVIMPLSMHRTVRNDTISRYSAIFFPSEIPTSARHLAAPVIMAIPLSKKAFTQDILTALTKNDIQEVLARSSGLAPAQANSNVADRQADDVRYWVAATNAPLPALSEAAFTNDARRSACVKALRNLILATADTMEREKRGY
jgi:hypothetical protein